MAIRLKGISCRAPLAASILAGSFFTSQALATSLLPGGSPVATPGLATFAGLNQVADELVPVTGFDVFNNVDFSGTLESQVLSEPSGNLDFAYRLTTNSSGPDAINFITVDSYSNFKTDVDFITGSGTNTYGLTHRSSFGSGDTISLDYSAPANQILPGSSTDWVLVKTNARSFDNLGLTSFIAGGGATVNSFEPVPEPVSLSILAIGGTFLMSRRPGRQK